VSIDWIILITRSEGEETGELRVKSQNVFSHYHNRKKATEESFDERGFFRTGDIVSIDSSDGFYKIVGRASVDIIKSSGYKISALEIEDVLITMSQIREVAVVGVPSEQHGQTVGALISLKEVRLRSYLMLKGVQGEQLSLTEISDFCKDKLAPYKIPRVLELVPAIPRNAMGKMNKKELVKLFRSQKS